MALPVARNCSPYETILGVAFASLHPHVRCAHLPPLRAEGTIDVAHGAGWLVRGLTWLMNLPAAGLCQSARLDVAQDGAELIWMRRIGESMLRTRQRANGSRMEERSGIGRISFDLAVEDGALLYHQSAIHFAGVPVPSSLCPRVGAVVSATPEGWRVVVTVTWRGQLVCQYSGAIHTS